MHMRVKKSPGLLSSAKISEEKPKYLQDKKSLFVGKKHFLLTTGFQLPKMISNLRASAFLTSLSSKNIEAISGIVSINLVAIHSRNISTLVSRPVTNVLYAPLS